MPMVEKDKLSSEISYEQRRDEAVKNLYRATCSSTPQKLTDIFAQTAFISTPTLAKSEKKQQKEYLKHCIKSARRAVTKQNLTRAKIYLGPLHFPIKQKFNQIIAQTRAAWLSDKFKLSLWAEAHFIISWHIRKLFLNKLFANYHAQAREATNLTSEQIRDFNIAWAAYQEIQVKALPEYAYDMQNKANEKLSTFSLNDFINKITENRRIAPGFILNVDEVEDLKQTLNRELESVADQMLETMQLELKTALLEEVNCLDDDEESTVQIEASNDASTMIAEVAKSQAQIHEHVLQCITSNLAASHFRIHEELENLKSKCARNRSKYNKQKQAYHAEIEQATNDFKLLARSHGMEEEIDIILASQIGYLSLDKDFQDFSTNENDSGNDNSDNENDSDEDRDEELLLPSKNSDSESIVTITLELFNNLYDRLDIADRSAWIDFLKTLIKHGANLCAKNGLNPLLFNTKTWWEFQELMHAHCVMPTAKLEEDRQLLLQTSRTQIARCDSSFWGFINTFSLFNRANYLAKERHVFNQLTQVMITGQHELGQRRIVRNLQRITENARHEGFDFSHFTNPLPKHTNDTELTTVIIHKNT